MVCTSDRHTVKRAIPVAPDGPGGPEAVGVVHGLGSAVEGLSEGERVAVIGVSPCFPCESVCRPRLVGARLLSHGQVVRPKMAMITR
ncbi:alcohol dehydrogenase catalytic domain-containing protein [Streptomyces sp. ISL-10]|nr:alcohol dehydrogenase catalytic domain-containing protein [Streptomyces sp. ISL-10]MBT2365854.1 alcohol dehydrogenase catalytic domain-containing protein [Streptomyces sp. ISL-10]